MASIASIIILTYNNLDYTRQCLESVYAKTAASDFELIVVDNASTDPTRPYLEAFAARHPNCRVILNENNEGFARGNNIGAAAANGRYVIFLNNDTIVTSGWLPGLIRHLQDPSVGMVGPVTNSSGNETRIAVDYTEIKDLDAFAERYTQTRAGKSFEVRMLPFLCVALRREVFRSIGPLDERFGLGCFEDDDYALRMKEKGFRILVAEDVYVHHFGSATFARMDIRSYWQLFKTNLRKLEEKWGMRWTPPVQRPEFIPEQLRTNTDAHVFFTDTIANLEDQNAELRCHAAEVEVSVGQLNEEIKSLNRQLEDLSRQFAEQVASINSLQSELNNIHRSNGWAFLQALMRVRRFFIPEGSRRERIFRRFLWEIRRLRHSSLRVTLATALKKAREVFRRKLNRRIRPLPAAPSLPAAAPPLTPSQPHGSAPMLPFPLNRERHIWPLVSVILPVFNHADMLDGAARSVLENTYPNLELIILDDGSEDQIEAVLRKMAVDPRVRIFRQPNQKLPRALTHAHAYARGEFITWTSADNLLAPQAIETLVNTLLADPEAVLAYADVALIGDDGQPLLDESYRPQNQDAQRRDLLRLYRDARPLGYEADNYLNACFLYRREAARALEGHYADDLRGLEDYDFWLRLQKCGPFRHAGNSEPLYFYRVHRRTMSHELLTQERENHLSRIQRFIEYEARRRGSAGQRWTLALDPGLSGAERASLETLAAGLPVNLGSAEHQALLFTPSSTDVDRPMYVRCLPDGWQLVWESPWSGRVQTLECWKGLSLNPLLLKARSHRKNLWEFPQAGERPVIGCHLGLNPLALDPGLTRKMIAQHPGIFFAFADLPGQDDPEKGRLLTKGLENAVYLDARSLDGSYPLHACFEALWIPPLAGPLQAGPYGLSLSLSYTTARPLLLPREIELPPDFLSGIDAVPWAAPYQFYYFPGETLNYFSQLNRHSLDAKVLDRYLDLWKPEACLYRLLRYAGAIRQEKVPRPDFGQQSLPVAKPVSWPGETALRTIKKSRPLKVALALETLDKGGLEGVVASLARWLPRLGVEPIVLCSKGGGATAEQLQAEGVGVYVAKSDPGTVKDILNREKPDLVHSHLAELSLLQTVRQMGLPVVETVHNTYAWLNAETWESERWRSRYFTHAAAVSALVRKYYLKWNAAFSPEWIQVIPNGIDSARVGQIDRRQARRELGLSEEPFIFLNLSSYDGRKNQLGLLTAFNEVARQFPRSRLLCAGNVAFPQYHQALQKLQASLPAKEKINLYEYRRDTDLLLAAADCFILNSFFEGWSLAATEALMAGVPIIHSDCGSARELAGDCNQRGRVVPNPACEPLDLTWGKIEPLIWQKRHRNTEQVVEAMMQTIREREQWAARRSEIQAYARENFSILNMTENYIRLYERVLEGNLAPNCRIPG